MRKVKETHWICITAGISVKYGKGFYDGDGDPRVKWLDIVIENWTW